MENITTLVGRIFLAPIFIMAGYNKIGGYEGTQGYMDAMGVPGMLLPLVIILELGGGIALLVGWKAKYMAYALAGFCVLAAVLFHADFGEKMQSIMFMKNFAIAGGLLFIATYGAGQFSLDHLLGRKK